MVSWLLVSMLILGAVHDQPATKPVVPLIHAHAHNDYEHPRPLFDALDHGFCSVEADVYLENGQLLVGHTRDALRPERTLEKLYLDPLRERVRAHGGRVYRDGPTVFLLIDVKTEANATHRALHEVLARYAEILSTFDRGKFEQKAVTAVISGNRAPELLAAQTVRYAGIDGRLSDLDSPVPAHQMPWLSDRWTAHFHWQGDGPMPADERTKLEQLVRKAHQHGRLVRFWATPELPAFWREVRLAGVDLINTDKLAELQRFLLDAQR
ncbi:MAG TPA: phosphatidylinositol-specific phospholipase C/glycerophosphodiester phosphodiesterase family protein [Gemmataceae bacterium]|nr:phosphatidylinositol-specific phospholipase C/glycerophosphodiester phosphodiesterase family protein [Gemmataceae bacterium]